MSSAGMKFDEFLFKLRQVRDEFRAEHGREVGTVEELEDYVRRRKLRSGRRRHLTSLKGLGL